MHPIQSLNIAHKKNRSYLSVMLLTSFVLMLTDTIAQVTDSVDNSVVREERFLSLLVGFNSGENMFGEIGIARNRINIVGNHAAGSTLFFSTEFGLGGEGYFAPKIGCWAGGGVAPIAVGVNLLYYTNFSNGTVRVRPEVGLGLDRFKLVYGYNIGFTHKDFPGVNTNNLSIVILLQLKKLEEN